MYDQQSRTLFLALARRGEMDRQAAVDISVIILSYRHMEIYALSAPVRFLLAKRLLVGFTTPEWFLAWFVTS